MLKTNNDMLFACGKAVHDRSFVAVYYYYASLACFIPFRGLLRCIIINRF